jgi:hypothetical protein
MADVFAADVKQVTRGNGMPVDSNLPAIGLLNLKSITSVTALGGTNGTDAMLIHGDVWRQIEGNETENVLKNKTMTVTLNETRTTKGNFTNEVFGTTTDTRHDVHHQTNVNPRFDHFCHTRTETHDQPQVVHQPTTDTHTIENLMQYHNEKHQFTMLYIVGNGMKLEVDGFEGTAKGVVLDAKKFHFKNDTAKLNFGDFVFFMKWFTVETVPTAVKTSMAHLKAVLFSGNAGAAVNGDSPMG